MTKPKRKIKQTSKSEDKGVFLSDMTEYEYEEYIEKEERGWGGFINKVFNLGKDETN